MSSCAMNAVQDRKVCPCKWLINTAYTSVFITHDPDCAYSFGSVYTDAHGNTQTSSFPRDVMTVNPESFSLLQEVIRSDTIWYKTGMISKIIVVDKEYPVCYPK